LIAGLPEPGHLVRRSIAALAGLPSIAGDSGKRVGPRRVFDGRPIIRTILYLAALEASRCAVFRDFRPRLQWAGRPAKAALTAAARTLLVTLNAIPASGRDDTLAATIRSHLPRSRSGSSPPAVTGAISGLIQRFGALAEY
jgi:transposase